MYAPAAALCGLGTAVRDTATKDRRAATDRVSRVVPFQLAPTPDYLFQLSGLAVLAVAVAAVEWDLGRCVDRSTHGAAGDSVVPDGDSSDAE